MSSYLFILINEIKGWPRSSLLVPSPGAAGLCKTNSWKNSLHESPSCPAQPWPQFSTLGASLSSPHRLHHTPRCFHTEDMNYNLKLKKEIKLASCTPIVHFSKVCLCIPMLCNLTSQSSQLILGTQIICFLCFKIWRTGTFSRPNVVKLNWRILVISWCGIEWRHPTSDTRKFPG